jgi:photosynthetic reaction center H subunit
MSDAIIVGRLDVAELVFYAFVLFFIGLVFYLRREDRREGYPLEDAVTGRVDSAWGPFTSSTYKAFKLPFDRGVAVMPTKGREPVEIAARRSARFGGAPYVPTGNPLADGVGPAAYARRADWADLDMEGRPRIVPMSADADYSIASRDPDPRGMAVVAADGRIVGPVTEVWIDRSDRLIRYLELDLAGARTVLVPFNFAKLDRRRRILTVDMLSAAQFAGAPHPAAPGTITRFEEERIQAYFGGGALYGMPGRTEPLI